MSRLFKYFNSLQRADEFVDGRFRCWSLAYYRGVEDGGVRGDVNEGRFAFRPREGLTGYNHTQQRAFTLPDFALTSLVRFNEIFVFCMSRCLSLELWEAFGAKVCVEVDDPASFCSQVGRSLPSGVKFAGVPGRERIGHRVEYFDETDSPDTRWALPDRIARSKRRSYAHQREFRLIFSFTAALGFQNVSMALTSGEPKAAKDELEPPAFFDVRAGHIQSKYRIHDHPPKLGETGRTKIDGPLEVSRART